MSTKPEFVPKARELLVAFSFSRKSDEMRRTTTFSNLEEPDLVPQGYYAVVKVEYIPFMSIAVSQDLEEMAVV